MDFKETITQEKALKKLQAGQFLTNAELAEQIMLLHVLQ